MNIEERKQYNKVYYNKHKSEILTKLCQKVTCEFCHRTIIKNNLLSHQNLPICMRKANLILQRKVRKSQLS
jgi:hypothetical protein